jgi:hypothetical protein
MFSTTAAPVDPTKEVAHISHKEPTCRGVDQAQQFNWRSFVAGIILTYGLVGVVCCIVHIINKQESASSSNY